jgi:AcrR family transcriptional regulator
VELIVKRAHVAYKTFYNHFGNKEEAFVALFDTVMDEARDQIRAAVAANAEEPWPQQVAAALRALFGVILADPIVSKAVIVEAPTVGPAIAGRYQEATVALSPLLRRGRDFEPRAKELPKSLEDTLAGGVLWSAYQRLIVGEVDRIEELMPEAIVFVLRPYIGEGEAARWAEWSRGETTVPASAKP